MQYQNSNEHTEGEGKEMKQRILGAVFVVSFMLTGCGIDSIFDGGKSLATWIITAGVAVLSAWAITREENE